MKVLMFHFSTSIMYSQCSFFLSNFILARKVVFVTWEGNSRGASSASCFTFIRMTTFSKDSIIAALNSTIWLFIFCLILLLLIIGERNDWLKCNEVHMWILTKKQKLLWTQLLHIKQEKKKIPTSLQWKFFLTKSHTIRLWSTTFNNFWTF